MMRLAVQQSESDGFRRNLTLNRDTNARDELTARLRLTWNPNELWRWEAALRQSEADPWTRLWMLALLACLLGAWGWKSSRTVTVTRSVAAHSPSPVS